MYAMWHDVLVERTVKDPPLCPFDDDDDDDDDDAFPSDVCSASLPHRHTCIMACRRWNPRSRRLRRR